MAEYPYADGDKPTKEELESVVLEMKYTPQCNAVVREYEDEGVMFVLKVEDGEAYEVSMPIPKWVKVGQVVFRQPITITKEADTEWSDAVEEFRKFFRTDTDGSVHIRDYKDETYAVENWIVRTLSSRDTYWKERVLDWIETNESYDEFPEPHVFANDLREFLTLTPITNEDKTNGL